MTFSITRKSLRDIQNKLSSSFAYCQYFNIDKIQRKSLLSQNQVMVEVEKKIQTSTDIIEESALPLQSSAIKPKIKILHRSSLCKTSTTPITREFREALSSSRCESQRFRSSSQTTLNNIEGRLEGSLCTSVRSCPAMLHSSRSVSPAWLLCPLRGCRRRLG
jgi:hypothetical protein